MARWAALLSLLARVHRSPDGVEGERVLPCPRCQSKDVRSLGHAGSQLQWFTCCACQYVWSHSNRPRHTTEPPCRPDDARILIVDDDSALLRLMARALCDYGVVTAQSGAEALAVLRHCRPAVLVTDYLMPEMTGSELIARAREQQPALKALVLTGHGDLLQDQAWWTQERHLQKPCSIDELRGVIAELIGVAPEHRAA